MSGNRRACVDSNKLKMERIISKSYIYSEAKYVLCLIGFLFIVVHIRSVSKIPQNEDVNGRPLFAVKGTHGAKVKLYSAETLVPKPHITRKSCLDILRHSSEPYKPWMPMKGDKETFTAYLQSTKSAFFKTSTNQNKWSYQTGYILLDAKYLMPLNLPG